MNRLPVALVSLLLVAGGVGSLQAELLINANATIDYAVDDRVRIIEGLDPPTTVEILATAYIGEDLLVYDASVVHMAGGNLHERLQTYDSSTANISGGFIGDDVVANDSSMVNVVGGELGDYVEARGSSAVNVIGGTLWGADASDNASIYISGGLIRAWPQELALAASGSSTITIEGSGFNYPYGPIPDSSGTLTGVLANGDPTTAGFEIHDAASILLVPEPSTLVLLGLGGLGLLAGARQRRRQIA